MYRDILRHLYLAAVLLVGPAVLASISIAQDLSREDALREAGRLATEAGQIRAEAYKQVQAGADRRLLLDVERSAAERFRKAVELWRSAGDDQRLVEGAEELSRIYSVLGEYEEMMNSLNREVEFWRARGDVARQLRLKSLLGIRQMQMRRYEAAVKTQQQVIELGRSAKMIDYEASALDALAMIYEISGRTQDAEQFRVRANDLHNKIDRRPHPPEEKKREPIVIPEQWIDLPQAPLIAEYRDVEGAKRAVLTNRSNKGIEMVQFGCVKEENGKVVVVGELVGQGLNHGGVGPGHYYDSFGLLNGPLNQWTDKKMGCEGGARMAVTRAVYADRTKWEAEGTTWSKP